MIAKNNVITEKEIVEFYKNKVFDTSKNMSLFYKLNQEYVDHLNNGSHVIKNPLTLRDDVNFTNDKISEIISTLNRNKNINISDITQACREIYKIIIRFGTIRYTRYFNNNNNQEVRHQEDNAVVFKHDFLAATYPVYNQIFNEQNQIDFSRFKDKDVTDATINEFINETIRIALGKSKIIHPINANDCHTNCHSDCHSNCKASQCRERDECYKCNVTVTCYINRCNWECKLKDRNCKIDCKVIDRDCHAQNIGGNCKCRIKKPKN